MPSSDLVWIVKDGVKTQVSKNDLDGYLKAGWKQPKTPKPKLKDEAKDND